MAKYFLGSVGKAEAFRVNEDGSRELAFVSKTLTDSGLNISTTKDDIRAGQGAPIQFSFYHDPSVEITLTDVLWKPEYLEAQLGARFKYGNEDYISDEVTFVNGEATYNKVSINFLSHVEKNTWSGVLRKVLMNGLQSLIMQNKRNYLFHLQMVNTASVI